MEFKANSGIWGTMFGIPCIVADNFLKLATGAQLKVLLFLLRNSGSNYTDEEVAANTGLSVQEVNDSVMFWQQVNVLSDTAVSSTKAPEQIMAPPPCPKSDAAVQISEAPKSPAKKRERKNLSASEISGFMQDSEDIAELFKAAEAAFGNLNHTKQDSLIWMYDYLGLKTEVILTLLYYCVNIGKNDPRYMETIAASWADNDINTLSAAQAEVERMGASRDYINMIMRSFSMNRITPKQKDIAEQWRKADYSPELIQYAYEKTIENLDRLNFDYINKILISWADSGFRSVSEVKAHEEQYKQKKKVQGNQNVSSDVEKYNIVINKFLGENNG